MGQSSQPSPARNTTIQKCSTVHSGTPTNEIILPQIEYSGKMRQFTLEMEKILYLREALSQFLLDYGLQYDNAGEPLFFWQNEQNLVAALRTILSQLILTECSLWI